VKPFDLNVDAMLKRLSLANARRTWRDLVARAEKEQWSYHDFLSTLVAEEVAHRQQTRNNTASRDALGRNPNLTVNKPQRCCVALWISARPPQADERFARHLSQASRRSTRARGIAEPWESVRRSSRAREA
jgi:hypothetical protein